MAKNSNYKHNILDEKIKERLISDIQEYFIEEREETIGVLGASSILDFFIENIGKSIYNKAIKDTKDFYAYRLHEIDLDADSLLLD